MQFLTGSIRRDTVRDFMPGTIFGLKQQGYSSDKSYICIVDAIDWDYDTFTDNPLDTSRIHYSYMEVGNAYGAQIKQESAELSAPVWEKVVHVEPEMAMYEFTRQTMLVTAEVTRQKATLLDYEQRALSFAHMADRIGGML